MSPQPRSFKLTLRRRLAATLLLALPLAVSAQQDLKDENLLMGMPTGYKVDFQAKKGNMLMTEMVPQAETVNAWTEMWTSQVFYGTKTTSPESFQANIQQGTLAVCKDAKFAPVAKGQENGYPFVVWMQSCPLNPQTGKPEHTVFKAVQGGDSFYVVQKAFKFTPSKDQVTQTMQMLRGVTVCDTRLPDRACVMGKPAR